jgi:hypothetical protein
LVRLAAARTPVARDVLQRVLDALVAREVAALRSVVEGLSRFTRRVLGLEGLDVIPAWMPAIAERVDALPPADVALDEAYAADVTIFTPCNAAARRDGHAGSRVPPVACGARRLRDEVQARNVPGRCDDCGRFAGRRLRLVERRRPVYAPPVRWVV